MSVDVWFYVRKGKIFKRVDNDGWDFLRRGTVIYSETEVSPEYMQEHHPEYWKNYIEEDFKAGRDSWYH